MGRQRITSSKKQPTLEQKRKKIEAQHTEWNGDEYDVAFCWSHFMVEQLTKNNAKATQSYYTNFYKKYCKYIEETFKCTPKDMPIDSLVIDISQGAFMLWLQNQGIGLQTINSYLRGYRAFGNFCEKRGYIEGFECPIKEVEPPVKQVYTDAELDRLMVRPPHPIEKNFLDWRTYCIIGVILNTGARSNTILNIRIEDVDLDEGYINFNTTKANRVIRLGLEKKVKHDLSEWIMWRYGKGAEPHDYLFSNEYGEQMSRSALTKSVRVYNSRHGVEKTSIHLLRHTFAKIWITTGGDIVTLSKVLTHSELEMVKRYSNLYGGDIKKEIQEHSAISQLKTKRGKTLRTKK